MPIGVCSSVWHPRLPIERCRQGSSVFSESLMNNPFKGNCPSLDRQAFPVCPRGGQNVCKQSVFSVKKTRLVFSEKFFESARYDLIQACFNDLNDGLFSSQSGQV